jgi:tetratricopeptide (TPR) repeat protein
MPEKNKRSSVWDDPITKWLGIFIVVAIIGSLLTVITALLLGIISFGPRPPMSRAEREALIFASDIFDEDATTDTWQAYFMSLIETNRLDEAIAEFDRLKGLNLDVSRGEQLLFMQAALLDAQGDKEGSIELLRQVVDNSEAAFVEERDNGSDVLNWARADGMHDNFKVGLSVIIFYQMDMGQNAEALASLDRYLEYYPIDAGMLILRAETKEALGDIEGAVSDYRAAQRFLPNDEDIMQRLTRLEESE